MALGTSYGLVGLPWAISALQIVVVGYIVLALAVLTTFDANGTYLEHVTNLGAAYSNLITQPSDFTADGNVTHEHTLVGGLSTSDQQWIYGSIMVRNATCHAPTATRRLPRAACHALPAACRRTLPPAAMTSGVIRGFRLACSSRRPPPADHYRHRCPWPT